MRFSQLSPLISHIDERFSRISPKTKHNKLNQPIALSIDFMFGWTISFNQSNQTSQMLLSEYYIYTVLNVTLITL